MLHLKLLCVQSWLSLFVYTFVKSMSAFVKPPFKCCSGQFSLLQSLLNQFCDWRFVFGGLSRVLLCCWWHCYAFGTTHCPACRLSIKSLICSLNEEFAQSNTLKVNLHPFPGFPREVRTQSLRWRTDLLRHLLKLSFSPLQILRWSLPSV